MNAVPEKQIAIVATDRRHLLSQLARIDISVPPAGEQRNRAKERWSACRLTATLAMQSILTYPVSLTIRAGSESPDVFLQSGGIRIGLELTTTPCGDHLDELAAANARYPEGYWIERSPDGTRVIPDDGKPWQLQSRPWVGMEPEIKWAQAVWLAVEKKLAKLPRYEACDVHWLLVYSSTPFPISFEKVTPFLRDSLAGAWKFNPTFCEIFVEHSDRLLQISSLEHRYLQVADLWSALE